MVRLIPVAFATASIPRRSGSSIATTWRARATVNISIRLRRFNMHQRAVLAGGCFWGMQELIRKLPGVVSTRVRREFVEAVRHDQAPPRREFPVLRADVVDGLAALGPTPATLDQVLRSGLVAGADDRRRAGDPDIAAGLKVRRALRVADADRDGVEVLPDRVQ